MCAMLARFFRQFSLRLVPDAADVEHARSMSTSMAAGKKNGGAAAEAGGEENDGGAEAAEAWLEQKTRERAADKLFKGLGFGHGIYPREHVPFEIVPRFSKAV